MKKKTRFRRLKQTPVCTLEKKRKSLETTPPPTATTTTPGTPATSTAAAPVCLLAGLVLRLGGVVHEQSVQRQAVGEDVITDRGATDVDGVQRDRVTALGGHFHGAEGSVHLRGDRGDGAVENSACIVVTELVTALTFELAVAK